jgi:hypothetical protein
MRNPIDDFKVLDKPKTPEPTYYTYTECSNCGGHNRIKILKGTLVKDVECPTCGCKTLSRQL